MKIDAIRLTAAERDDLQRSRLRICVHAFSGKYESGKQIDRWYLGQCALALLDDTSGLEVRPDPRYMRIVALALNLQLSGIDTGVAPGYRRIVRAQPRHAA